MRKALGTSPDALSVAAKFTQPRREAVLDNLKTWD